MSHPEDTIPVAVLRQILTVLDATSALATDRSPRAIGEAAGRASGCSIFLKKYIARAESAQVESLKVTT